MSLQTKRVSKVEKLVKLGKKVDLIFKVMEWSFYIVLCIVAGMFMIDVVTQFLARETVIGHSLKLITKLPTLTICIELEDSDYKYSIDQEYLEMVLWNHRLKFDERYDDGNISMLLTKISDNCMKLNASLTSPFPEGKIVQIGLKLNSYMPDKLHAYFTSEENSYGIFHKEWFDGNVFQEEMTLDHMKEIYLTPTEHKFLENGGKFLTSSNKINKVL